MLRHAAPVTVPALAGAKGGETVMTNVALLMAAGRGQRFGGAIPKQYADLAGCAVMRRTALCYLDHPLIDLVVAVIHPDDRDKYEAATAGLDLAPPIMGGDTRQESVRNGLQGLAPYAPESVLIHDAARPLVASPVIDRVLAAIGPGVGAIAALPVHDSLRHASDGLVDGDVERDGVWRAQTPQGFRYRDILSAHLDVATDGFTDDASVARAAGLQVAVVEGHEDGFKITTSDDLRRAEARIAERVMRCQVGMGFDVHRFGPGDTVQLGGIAIPHDRGLAGHSDADVALHALTDAVLGSVGAGDIGHHFPPSDPRWKGADSSIFLAEAARQVRDRGGDIGHVDLTIICERPKIGPHREAMRARISEILGIGIDAVSVKATTTEGLGFTGRREGIAAQAVATIRLPAR